MQTHSYTHLWFVTTFSQAPNLTIAAEGLDDGYTQTPVFSWETKKKIARTNMTKYVHDGLNKFKDFHTKEY